MEKQPAPARSQSLRALARSLVIVFALVAFSATFLPSTGASSGTITGSVFLDSDRDGVFDPEETARAGDVIYLFRDGAYIAQATTDASGRYAMTGLADGRYEVKYDAGSWAPIKMELVPTTTGSVIPSVTVDLFGSAVADFGWRTIMWSTDPNTPIATRTAPNGLRVEAFNDAVPPQDVVDVVMEGLVGVEASTVVIRLGLGPTSATTTSVVNRGGVDEDFSAAVSLSYEAWLEYPRYVVGHEYGHAWSWYHAYMTQHDPTMATYLAARNLDGDARVGSSYMWGVGELIAEDYRQLLGPPGGRANPQANPEIPAAADVAGLGSFLENVFTAPPATPEPSPSPTPTPTPTPSLDVSGLIVSPSPVKRSATITFALSAPASVTIVILGNGGNIVNTVLATTSEPAGSLKFAWNRTDASGKRVKAGAYTVKVKGEDLLGNWDTAFATFPVA